MASNPFAFDEQLASTRTRAPRSRDDALHDEHDPDDEDVPRSRSAARRNRSSAFAIGCGLAKWGAVIEIVGVAYLFLLFELVMLEVMGALRVSRALSKVGPIVVMLPFFVPILIGTAMMGVGRLRMTQIPSYSGASTVFSTAGVGTFLRFLLLLVAAVLLGVSTSERMGGNYAAYAVGAMLAGWVIGTLAEMTSVAAMAAVGGATRNRQLYSTAAGTGLVHLVIGLVLIFLFLISYFAGLSDVIAREREPERPGLAAALLLFVFALQVVFTYTQYTLYAAGEQDGRSTRGAA